MDDMGRIMLAAASPLIFIGLWLGVCRFVSRTSGWARLAECYEALGPFEGERRVRMRSIGLRSRSSYGNCVTLGVEESGLWVSVMFLFRFGHPALFIPWSEITPRTVEERGESHVILEFASIDDVTLRVRRDDFEKLYGPLDIETSS